MENLICHTENCEYCVKSRCLAGMVSISPSGVCKTKSKRSGGMLEQTFADIEAGEDFGILDSNETAVHCESCDCKYNRGMLCFADHIVVDDGLLKTKCQTRSKQCQFCNHCVKMPNNTRIFTKINDCIVSDRHSLTRATKKPSRYTGRFYDS